MSTPLGLLVILVLVLGNAFFVIAEYALVTASRTGLGERAAGGSSGSLTALRLMDDPVRFIGTVQVGITGLGILLGAVGEPVVREIVEPPLSAALSFALAFLVITYLSVVLGELVPKAVALQRADAVASVVARPIDLLQRAFGPVVWVLQGSARIVLRPLRIPAAPAGSSVHTVEELRGVVAEAEDSGLIEEAEEEMLYRVFDFAGQEAADVMVPWSEVVVLDAEMTLGAAVDRALLAGFSRFPVMRGSIDDVVGYLHLRDLLGALRAADASPATIEPLVRELAVVLETKDVAALLQEMREDGHQLSLVINEYGSTLGIVTLHDVVEEIVGEIEQDYGLADEAVQRIDDRRVRVSGTFTTDDFNEQFGTALPDDDYRTLGGLVFGELGRQPRPGDAVRIADVGLQVDAVEGVRVGWLIVTLPGAPR